MKKRDYFEIGSKLIGMLFIISGFLYWFSIITTVIAIPETIGILLISIKFLENISIRLVILLIVQGIIPFLIGSWLMTSNNYFVNWAYPIRNEISEDDLIIDPRKQLGTIADDELKEEDDYEVFGKCPMCGSELEKRIIPKGPHMGKEIISCKKFPNCKYVKPYRKKKNEDDSRWAPKGFKM